MRIQLVRAGTNSLELLWTNVTSADTYLLQVQPYELSAVPSKPKTEGTAIKADGPEQGESGPVDCSSTPLIVDCVCLHSAVGSYTILVHEVTTSCTTMPSSILCL